ncbi:hypothetical protein DYBT9275_00802 [Dyadobacter sp. CECT 9275]|uniref:Uncharacterized protein n=1 Tax=Dyadobacter helix TaxID=2822344 RepID=A0A916NJX3_9BACT|nr:hypothetical protein [Dyadobacter sp. CECT 9275]CAG4991653.1 hypothetical protein DYBT9275_00802 [Dyadobacter sp. CECT 9275]
MEERSQIVDAAINAYGKPYQTAVTLLTLLRHSGEWINKIYFVEEKKQPEPSNFKFILDYLGDKVVYYRPKVWLWTNKLRFNFLKNFKKYRYAIRYQYAWEKSDSKYLLVLHNDVYFKGDLVGAYLENLGAASGIGRVGQCWVCPAYSANLCNPDKYTAYRPSYLELMELSVRYPQARTRTYSDVVNPAIPWPLPECRLNEYVAMIDLEKTRKDTIPLGKGSAFGSYERLDVGVKWFFDMNNLGHSFQHFDYDPYATHSWISLKNAGHDALFNEDVYQYEESVAKEVLKREFGISNNG